MHKKHIFILLIIPIFILESFSQSSVNEQVERELVVVEIGTGTWCTYCPGASMGADDLVENGHKVAIIEYHNGDSYTNPASTARNIYNGVSIFPTAIFDGLERITGGNHTQSMYSSYLPEYNSRITVMSGYSIELSYTNTGNNYSVNLQVQKHDPNASHSQLKLRVALTESHIQQNWQGQTELNFVERLMIPDHEGTVVDFSSGNTQQYTFNFAIDPTWNKDFCELVAFLQTDATKEILQGTKKTLAQAIYTYDAAVQSITYPDVPVCGDSVQPVVVIKNNGSENLTSLDIHYQINDESETVYNWTGNLAFPDFSRVVLPKVGFNQLDTNNISVTSGNPNGFIDENLINDTATHQFYDAPEVLTQHVHLELRTDNYGYETSWKLFDEQGTVLYLGDDFANNQVYSYDFELEALGCYEFVIYDTFGDGICAGSGNGYFKLVDDNGGLIGNGCDFGAEGHVPFKRVTNVGVDDYDHFSGLSINPNPFSQYSDLVIGLNENQFVTVDIISLTGNHLFQVFSGDLPHGLNHVLINMKDRKPGVYLLKIQTREIVKSMRIIVTD